MSTEWWSSTLDMGREGLSSAEMCRRLGWGPGTVIEVTVWSRTTRNRITAVGERSILARLEVGGAEGVLFLEWHDWREVRP